MKTVALVLAFAAYIAADLLLTGPIARVVIRVVIRLIRWHIDGKPLPTGPIARAVIRLIRWHIDGKRLRLSAMGLGLKVGRWESRTSIRKRIKRTIRVPFGGSRYEWQWIIGELCGVEPGAVRIATPAPGVVRIAVPRTVSDRKVTAARKEALAMAPCGVEVTIARETPVAGVGE